MANSIENLSSYTLSNTGAANVSTSNTITTTTFTQMVDVLEALANHNHIFYDDYTTVCQCQCQCACNRGTV